MGAPAIPTDLLTGPLQTGRALIGWMTAAEAVLSLSGRQVAHQNQEEHRVRAERARAAVAARGVGLDQDGIVVAAPPELDAHITALRQNPVSQQYFNEGWQVSVVDLANVCAAQPHIITGQANLRVEQANAEHIDSLAAVSLPLAVGTVSQVVFDPTKNTWIFSSSNPNLRVVGNFHGNVPPGQNGFGFVVGVASSFLQVARYGNRYILRDGYHRAFGFLSRGIARVPAFVREVARYEELGFPAGMLPLDSFLGDRPPTLRDYLDEDVSAEIQIPVTQKMVLIQAIELSTLG
jgi:hypothetical protein